MSDLRRRISSAAQELYLREGIEGISMRKVAELVGVSAPAIYRHFESKERLLDEIVIEGLRVLEDYLRPALDAPTPYDRLLRLTDRYLAFATEQPKYFDFAFRVPNRDIDRFADEVARPDWGTFQMAIQQVAACMQQGVFAPADPLDTAIVLWAEVHGLVTLYRTGRFGQDAQTFEQIYRKSIDRLMTALKG